MAKTNIKSKKIIVLILMMLALATIYVLPYLRYTFYIPLQEAMNLVGENKKYGMLTSIYGIANFLLYIPGGWMADRFDPKKLMVFSMVSTGALGLWLSTWPGYTTLLLIYALFGITTVLTFWSASIKCINVISASDEQVMSKEACSAALKPDAASLPCLLRRCFWAFMPYSRPILQRRCLQLSSLARWS